MEYMEYTIFTLDSKTVYQKIGKIEEKVRKWTLGGNNKLIYEVFPHTNPNEKYGKMGFYTIPERKVITLSPEQYSQWVNFLRDCALHGEYKENGDRRCLGDY